MRRNPMELVPPYAGFTRRTVVRVCKNGGVHIRLTGYSDPPRIPLRSIQATLAGIQFDTRPQRQWQVLSIIVITPPSVCRVDARRVIRQNRWVWHRFRQLFIQHSMGKTEIRSPYAAQRNTGTRRCKLSIGPDHRYSRSHTTGYVSPPIRPYAGYSFLSSITRRVDARRAIRQIRYGKPNRSNSHD